VTPQEFTKILCPEKTVLLSFGVGCLMASFAVLMELWLVSCETKHKYVRCTAMALCKTQNDTTVLRFDRVMVYGNDAVRMWTVVSAYPTVNLSVIARNASCRL